MKRFLFFGILLLLAGSCRQAGTNPSSSGTDSSHRGKKNPDVAGANSYVEVAAAKPITHFEQFDNTGLEQSLAGLLRQEQLVLIDKNTPAHTSYSDKLKGIQLDSFRADRFLLVSAIQQGDRERQQVKLNGHTVYEKKAGSKAIKQRSSELLMEFDASAFRHFRFYGKEYYYFQSRQAFMDAASAGNVTYHWILDAGGRTLGLFESCRFSKILLGDANGDRILDFLEFDNADFCTTVPSSDRVTVRLFSAGPKGKFVLQKNLAGKPWFITASTGMDYLQDSFRVKEINWPRFPR